MGFVRQLTLKVGVVDKFKVGCVRQLTFKVGVVDKFKVGFVRQLTIKGGGCSAGRALSKFPFCKFMVVMLRTA